MILPTTYVSALLLLILSFFCLGSWAAMFKLTGPRWRFELFYIDFAIGAVLLSIIAAYTLGMLGPDLAFTDRMLVAGRGSQVFVLASGFVFNLGNMLLLAAVALLGMSPAFPLSIGLAVIVTCLFNFRSANLAWLIAGIAVMIIALLLDGSACRFRGLIAKKPVQPKPNLPRPQSSTTARVSTAPKVAPKMTPRPAVRTMKKNTKGLMLAIVGGVLLGLFYPIAARGLSGELTLGPYAGILLFSIGVLLSTIMYNFYFLNIAIEGEPLSFRAYGRGRAPQHFLGFAGGALWAGGMLAAMAANAAPPQAGLPARLIFILPLASVLLAMLWGALAWKEFASAPAGAKISLALAGVLFLGSVILVGIGLAS